MRRYFIFSFFFFFLISLIFIFLSHKPFSLGMDVSGGTILTYQAEIKNLSREKQKEALEQTKDLIERRINFLGLAEFFISFSGDGKFLVEIPHIKNPEEAIKIIGETPLLEFAYPIDITKTENLKINTSSLSKEDINKLFIKSDITGKNIEKAEVQIDPRTMEPNVVVYFDKEGTKKFKELTEKYLGQPIAIYLDNQIISAPIVRDKIETGQAQISGNFTLEEAKILAQRLNQGALPIPLKLIAISIVAPSMGQKFLSLAIKGSTIGILLVMLFMLAFYRFHGLVADLALLVFIVFNLALYKLLGITISLASLTGFVLSVGMAVDANILIFERVREEIKRGLKQKEAIKEGFIRAFSSIRDSNVTTIISSLVIYFLATSFVKGFALTLFLGVLISFLTATFFTHYLLEEFYSLKNKKNND